MELDPAFGWTLRFFLAALFARALYGKLRAPGEFATAIRGYELLPPGLAGVVSVALIAVEFAIVALLLSSLAPAAAALAAALLLLYGAAIGINLARGRRDIDCGCSGPAQRQSLHELLIGRNLVYAGIAMVATLPLGARSLGWLDVTTIALALAALAGLALAIDGIAALAPRLANQEARS